MASLLRLPWNMELRQINLLSFYSSSRLIYNYEINKY